MRLLGVPPVTPPVRGLYTPGSLTGVPSHNEPVVFTVRPRHAERDTAKLGNAVGKPVSIEDAVLCHDLDSGHPSVSTLLNALPKGVAY